MLRKFWPPKKSVNNCYFPLDLDRSCGSPISKRNGCNVAPIRTVLVFIGRLVGFSVRFFSCAGWHMLCIIAQMRRMYRLKMKKATWNWGSGWVNIPESHGFASGIQERYTPPGPSSIGSHGRSREYPRWQICPLCNLGNEATDGT